MQEKAPIILITGKPGSGKSRIAHEIAKKTGFQVIDTLLLRQLLIKAGESTNGFDVATGAKYSPQALTLRIRYLVEELIPNRGLIIDGVWKTEERRQEIIEAARDNDRPILLIHIDANYEKRVQRVTNRQQTGIGLEDSNQKSVVDYHEQTYQKPNGNGVNYVEINTNTDDSLNIVEQHLIGMNNQILSILNILTKKEAS